MNNLCPPAKLFGNSLDLSNESVMGARAADLGITRSCPAIDLLDGPVATAKTSCVFKAVFPGGGSPSLSFTTPLGFLLHPSGASLPRIRLA